MAYRVILFIVILFSYGCSTYLQNKRCNHTDQSFRCVVYVSNYDGDTIKFNIPNVHSLIGKNISIRLNGVDTPELRTKDNCERKKALLAKALVEKELTNASVINLHNIKRGKYFRVLADIEYDSKSIKDELIRKKTVK